MRGATYNQLMIFQAIVEESSIRGAARKLEISPPSASKALKSLEKNLGLPLFNRTTRSMELTEAGQLLYENTTTAVSSLNAAMESVHDLSTDPKGSVRITLPKFVYQWLLEPIYADFCRQYPEINLEVSISDATVDLISEGLDLGIRFGHKVQEGMIARQLTAPIKEALFASDDYLQNYGIPKSLSDLSNHRQIQYRFIASNKIAPLTLEDNGSQIEIEMRSALIVNDTDMMVDAAKKGLGIGRIALPIVEHKLQNGTLTPVLEEYWETYPGLYLYFPQNSQKARRVRVLIDFLVERISSYNGAYE
ncbi:LysR family transcriptional regulator [Neptuniibacter sp. PT8_73]|uniref:LysR family transcriptional regulator n=1 Tax=unclassified Neptuniibacter TaxID=2630693 RepID=UPI0039F60BCE